MAPCGLWPGPSATSPSFILPLTSFALASAPLTCHSETQVVVTELRINHREAAEGPDGVRLHNGSNCPLVWNCKMF